MKIFLDTANLEVIKKWNDTGIIDGVTTNPTHLSTLRQAPLPSTGLRTGFARDRQDNRGIKELLKKICSVMSHGDVSIEVTETEPEKVYTQAKKIAAIAENVVVKIPCHQEYYAIIKKLVAEEVQLNITLLFSLIQGLFMCKLGVKYISPFVGRLDDIDTDGMDLIDDLRIMVDEYQFENTKILAASIRNLRHFHDAILIGSDVITVPATVLEKATQHPLTDKGMKKFIDDWKKLGIKQFP